MGAGEGVAILVRKDIPSSECLHAVQENVEAVLCKVNLGGNMIRLACMYRSYLRLVILELIKC